MEFLSDMQVRLTRVEGNDLDVARAAWVSTKGERAADEGDPERISGLINMLMRDRHGSPFEQCGLQFLTSCPIFVWREHYRHRIASYNEQSSRYMQLEAKFYVPDRERLLVQTGKAATYTFSEGDEEHFALMHNAIVHNSGHAYKLYLEMIEGGVAKEVARMVLPVNIYSTAYVRMNLRALMNFLSLRVKSLDSTYPSNPQHEINLVADQYEEAFLEHFPITYEAFIRNGRVAP